jgi:hypothetical protein
MAVPVNVSVSPFRSADKCHEGQSALTGNPNGCGFYNFTHHFTSMLNSFADPADIIAVDLPVHSQDG